MNRILQGEFRKKNLLKFLQNAFHICASTGIQILEVGERTFTGYTTMNRKRNGDITEPVRTHINTILNYQTKWLQHVDIMSETEL